MIFKKIWLVLKELLEVIGILKDNQDVKDLIQTMKDLIEELKKQKK